MEKEMGKCKICGKEKKLTFEHIPPKASFNGQKVEIIKGDELIKTITGKRLPWDTSGLKKKVSQNGTKVKTLCSKCNSFTGQHYGSWYVDLVGGFHNFIQSNKPKANEYYEFDLHQIKPLNIFKQIISMFCSTTSITMTHPIIRKFLLDIECNEFPEDEFRVLLNIFISGIPKITGPTVMSTIRDHYLLSQIVAYPFELTLIMNYDKLKSKDLTHYGTDITNFTKYKYNAEEDIKFKARMIESFTSFPLERRGKDEIEKVWKDSQ